MNQSMEPKYSCCIDGLACMKFKTWLDGHYCYENGGKLVKDCATCKPSKSS